MHLGWFGLDPEQQWPPPLPLTVSPLLCHISTRRPLYRLVFALMPATLQALVAVRHPRPTLETLSCMLWIDALFLPRPAGLALCMVRAAVDSVG